MRSFVTGADVKDGPLPLEMRAEAFRALAGLLRIGLPPRGALIAWRERARGPLRPALARVARLLDMGLDLQRAVVSLRPVLEQDADALSVLLSVTTSLGGGGEAMVETLATSVEERAAALAKARAAGSGAKLSGRLVAGLPLAFLPLAPLARGPLLDRVGVVILLVGAALAAAGMMWIARLTPSPPSGDDPAAALADLVAAVLAGGSDLVWALDVIARTPPEPIAAEMGRAARLVRLGLTWPEALERVEDAELASVGRALGQAHALGLPVATTLRAWARSRRSDLEHQFDAATRRAAVLMMVPLATCVLPSFILLGVMPFLRGLSIG